MQAIVNRRNRILQIAAAVFPLVTFAARAQADIFHWEYINPSDPSQGKRQSTALAWDGAGVDAVPGADLSYRDLSAAYLIGADLASAYGVGANLSSADLTNADLRQANLTNVSFILATLTGSDLSQANLAIVSFSNATLIGANLSQANLANAYFYDATLTNAVFTGAEVRTADLSFTGITLAQLYSTASYQAQNLSGIILAGNDLSGGNFADQNLTDASFYEATLTDAEFTDADVRGATFYPRYDYNTNMYVGGLTPAQLYATASYKSHDLTGIGLVGNDLSGWNFADQNLDNANISGTLTDADFTGAEVPGAFFSACGTGLTSAQLYSTASYQAQNLTGIRLGGDVSGWNFAGQKLTDATFDSARAAAADFRQANLTNARFGSATLTDADFRDANLTNASFGAGPFGSCPHGWCSPNPSATLTGADFTGADVRGANFENISSCIGFLCTPLLSGTGITLAQLYSTASYKSHDLTGIGLARSNLTGANFAGQNLTNASFSAATLTDADFTGADVRGADFTQSTSCNNLFCSPPIGGIALAQLYSTDSYQTRELIGIRLGGNNLAGGNFAGQNLTDVTFEGAELTSADFRQANLTNASFLGATLTDAEFTDADVRGATFFNEITLPQLYSTASYQADDLTGIQLRGHDLSGANFAGQNLTNANFSGTNRHSRTNLAGANLSGANLTNVNFTYSTLTGANFTNARVQGSVFRSFVCLNEWCGRLGGIAITSEQLYSTASYQAHDLTGIVLVGGILTGVNFERQNLTYASFGAAELTGANFREANLAHASFIVSRLSVCDFNEGWCSGPDVYATLTNADLTAADARGAFGLELTDLSGAATANLIWPDGHVDGLNLDRGGRQVVRDYDGPSYNPALVIPITVDQHMVMGPGGTLRMVFEADDWDSTISFAPGIPVKLGGTLELTFADDVNLASQVGRTFDLFDWTGVSPSGVFAVSTLYAWDLSNLYTTGEVTLTSVPEPRAFLLFSVALAVLVAIGRLRPSSDAS